MARRRTRRNEIRSHSPRFCNGRSSTPDRMARRLLRVGQSRIYRHRPRSCRVRGWGPMAATTASTHARNQRSRNLCGWRHTSRKCEADCLRGRRRFNGGTPRASISCRVRGTTRVSSTSTNGTGFGQSLTGSQAVRPCELA
jgi:hypothetical protein